MSSAHRPHIILTSSARRPHEISTPKKFSVNNSSTKNEEYWTVGDTSEICPCRSATACFFLLDSNLTRKSTSQLDNNLLNSDLSHCAAQWDQNVENSIRLPLSDLKDYCTTILNKYVIQRTQRIMIQTPIVTKRILFGRTFLRPQQGLVTLDGNSRALAVRREGPLLHLNGTPLRNLKEYIKSSSRKKGQQKTVIFIFL